MSRPVETSRGAARAPVGTASRRSASPRLALATLVVLSFVSGCGDNGTGPAVVASVEVTSPLGPLLDVGAGTQLTAAARSAAGDPVGGADVTWTSSDSNVVSVTASGTIKALAAGSAAIRAEAGGVTGSLALHVVDADIPGITALASDPFATGLAAAASSDIRGRLQSDLTDCTTGASQGRLEAVQDGVADVRAEAAADATDRAVLAVLDLFADELERRLGL